VNAPPFIADMEAEAAETLRIELPFPDKILWPNGRGHHMAKHRAFKKHKQWAHDATLAAIPRELRTVLGPIRLRYTITPKTAHPIDRDNAVAAMKAYQDGIAAALVVDDSCFATPAIEFAPPKKPGSVEVTL
jgi:crossover junction endodeoxyribonuclease RusA